MVAQCRHDEAQPSCATCRLAFSSAVLDWANHGTRSFPWRGDRNPYRVTIAEILLQQTRAENVAAIFDDFVGTYPNWSALARAALGELETRLRPLGLQRRRAAGLLALAQEVTRRGGGLPATSQELSELPAIGQYISRAIATQISAERCAAVDVNVARVLERVFGPRTLADIRYDPYLQTLALDLASGMKGSRYLFALLDFASAICTARNPRCDSCPMLFCKTRESALGRRSKRAVDAG